MQQQVWNVRTSVSVCLNPKNGERERERERERHTHTHTTHTHTKQKQQTTNMKTKQRSGIGSSTRVQFAKVAAKVARVAAKAEPAQFVSPPLPCASTSSGRQTRNSPGLDSLKSSVVGVWVFCQMLFDAAWYSSYCLVFGCRRCGSEAYSDARLVVCVVLVMVWLGNPSVVSSV